MAYAAPPVAGTPAEVTAYLRDLSRRLEFAEFSEPTLAEVATGEEEAKRISLESPRAYLAPVSGPQAAAPPRLRDLQLHAMQMFVARFMAPECRTPRVLLGWDTGTGKTIAAITIAQNYARLFGSQKLVAPQERPTVFVIGFTRSVIQAEMLRDPKHGFITHQELAELRRLRAAARPHAARRPIAPEVRQYNGYLGTMRRMFTDRTRGGYYQFYGYKEFANNLLVITPQGEREGVKVMDLFLRPSADDDSESSSMEEFVRRISGAESRKHVRVNQDLLRRLRRGLVVADEIHNVYNSSDPNMYGVALQYVFDAFAGDDAPRAVFMSATPMTGSPTEVVDFLNLLVPRADLPGQRPLVRSDLFTGSRGDIKYREGALDLVAQLATGRVTYHTVDMEDRDASDLLFPDRVFEGDYTEIGGRAIPYLKFVETPVSPLQAAALKAWAAARAKAQALLPAGGGAKDKDLLPSAADYALYDMVFPDPDDEGGALYTSASATPIYATLAHAPAAWRQKHGVVVLPETVASGRSAPTVGGAFLALRSLEKYSGKYARFVEDVTAIVKTRPGKILAYHDRIQLTGVALIGEILTQNGFTAVGVPPVENTLCSVCGAKRGAHTKKSHDYRPARYAVVTGAMDPGAREQALGKFNARSNLDGHEVRILVGSQVIREGLNFQASRFQILLSIPRNISILLQILGRTSRRGAYSALPSEERRVETTIYLNENPAPGVQPPDRTKVRRKMHDYIMIQEGCAAVRRNAVNGFLPQSARPADAPASLEGLPFTRPVTAATPPLTTDTYYAYDRTSAAVSQVVSVLKTLFRRQPVWSRAELYAALRQPGYVGGQAINPVYLSDGVFALALAQVTREGADVVTAASGNALVTYHFRDENGTARRIVECGEGVSYFITVPVMREGARSGPKRRKDADGPARPVVDIESYVRTEGSMAGRAVEVPLRPYVQRHLNSANFTQRLAEFEARYADARPAEMQTILTRYDSNFHYNLLEIVVRDTFTGKPKHGPAVAGAARLYRRYKVTVTLGQLRRSKAAAELVARIEKRVPRAEADAPVGYTTPTTARVYVPDGAADGKWKDVGLRELGYALRPENPTAVGYMEVRGAQLQFKVRESLQTLIKKKVKDVRFLARGAVCATRSRETQVKLAQRLGVPAADLKKGNSSGACSLILQQLLAREAAARAPRTGMSTGLRWFYLFNEKPPVVRAGKGNV
jgi:hypothetical protein